MTIDKKIKNNFIMKFRKDSCPNYYYSFTNNFEVWDVAEAWGLDKDAYLFNVLKYIIRAGKKNRETKLEDLKKARSYIERAISNMESESITDKNEENEC